MTKNVPETVTEQTNEGREALARLLRSVNPNLHAGVEHSDQTWNDFKAAVAEAQAQLREEDSAGVRRWQNMRHGIDK